MAETYLVFQVFVYEVKDPVGQFINSCQVEVIAKNREEAERKAIDIVNDPVKKSVHTKLVIEKMVENHDRT
jgi:hypothetical protein